MADDNENYLKIVSENDAEIRVANHIVLFNHRDLEGIASKNVNADGSKGEYFTKATQFESPYTEQGKLEIDWEHGRAKDVDGLGKGDVLGYVDWSTAKITEFGIWVERVLSRRNKYVEWIKKLIQNKVLGNSTETADGLPVVKAADGEIKVYPLYRDSFTVQPMEYKMMTLETITALKALGINFDNQDSEAKPEAEPKDAVSVTGDAMESEAVNKEVEPQNPNTRKPMEKNKMANEKALSPEDKAEVMALVAEQMKKIQDEQMAQAEAVKAEGEKIDTAVKAAVEAERAKSAAGRRLPDGEAPYQTKYGETWKYDNLSPGEIGLTVELLKKNPNSDREQVPQAAVKALALRLIEDKRDFGNRDLAPGYSLNAMKSANVPTTPEGVKAVTDPIYTGGTTDGGNWVHTSYSRELWAAVRAQAAIVSQIPSVVIPDGFKSSTFPLEGTDFTFYSAAEASASNATLLVPAATVGATQITTPTNKELTVAKMGARGIYTGEFTEDSIINAVPQLMDQLKKGQAEQLEHALIDGDSQTTNANINTAGGTVPTSTGISRDLYLMFDGFRKLALVTNTANSRSAGALSEEDYLETMWLMGTAGLLGADTAQCFFVVDPNVYKKSLQLATLKTKDVWTRATLEGNALSSIWGYPLFPSWFMHFKSAARLANSSGKVDQDVTTNNTLGAILAVRKDQWKFGYKRQMTIETTRVANADSYEIVAWARLGLAYRDTESSAISYNVTV